MSNIKKVKEDGSWGVVASGKSTGIATTNPKLTKGKSVASVDEVLEDLLDKVNLHDRNIAWLALHGGGGSGTGGGGSTVVDAPCTILINGSVPTGQTVYLNKEGLNVSLTGMNALVTKNWAISIRIGSREIMLTTASYARPLFTISYEKIAPFLTNYMGNLIITASYEDDALGVYGSAVWNGLVLESAISIYSSDIPFTTIEVLSALVTYTYSAGIIGPHTLNFKVSSPSGIVNTITKDITIFNTSEATYTISATELLGLSESELSVGVYTIEATILNTERPNIQSTHTHSITIISDNIFISSNTLSKDSNNPTEINISGSLSISFTAYLQGRDTFRYRYLIEDTVIKDYTNDRFNRQITDVVAVIGKPWALEGLIKKLTISIDANDKKADFDFYIKFVAAAENFLNISDEADRSLATEFLSRNYNSGESSFNLVKDGYAFGGNLNTINSKLLINNINNLSAITVLSNGTPYLRVSNGAYGILKDWQINNANYTLSNICLNTFTISLAFKADYHPDDNRTILFCGTADSNTGNITSGISIDVHDVYINNLSVVKLVDNTINCIDITCNKVLTETLTPTGETVLAESYLVKVYLNGVLTAVNSYQTRLEIGDCIYLGSRVYIKNNEEVADYLCDCNIYNLQLYSSALSDLDIMTNYINNLVSTEYTNGTPRYNIITSELRKNFCELDSEGLVVAHLYKNNSYTIDFLIKGDRLDEDALNNYAKVLGIPIMLIDVGTDSSWTFDAFVTLQTAGAVSLSPTSGRVALYWDPNGTNSNIVTLDNVTVELLGTSTLADAVKNINITIPDSTAFTPKSTWFPELTYTLKADVVDSSHSNNAAIGKFINEVLGYDEEKETSYYPFAKEAIDNVYKSDYKLTLLSSVTLKHTVEGFPVFLIMRFYTLKTGDISITPLGIYSFNIGRNAYRNLGFKKVNSVTNSLGEKINISTFPFYLNNVTFNEEDSNANWIEISDTTSIKDMEDVTDSLPLDFDSSKGDFWLNDDAILDARYEVRYPKNTAPSSYNNFKTFVSNIMSLPIESTYSTDSLGNVNFSNITDSYKLYKLEGTDTYVETGQRLNIVTDINALTSNLGFNEESVYKYFVIGLLFGLIDNYGKNSTYRSWGREGQYYVDFYDLDSALGGGNQGLLDISPDVWLKYIYNKTIDGHPYGYVNETFNKSKADSLTTLSANHNKLWLSVDTEFFRRRNNKLTSYYTEYWYNLRNYLLSVALSNGYDNFIDYFINEFYLKLTGDCGPLLFNYDYKLKYLLLFTDDSTVATKDITKLHGRKLAYTKDWLTKHITFLDSLFYWRDKSLTMLFPNDVATRGSNTVYNTPDAFPVKSNTSLIFFNSVGNTTLTFYFLPKNKEVFVNAGSNSSNSALTWNFSNSNNIILLGNDDITLSNMNVSVLAHASNNNSLNYQGYPSITELNLRNNNIFGSSFTLNSFLEAPISELRTLDFSNTSGASFPLSLTYEAGGLTYTKYTKLLTIDISNSKCVSNLILPEIPLTSLKVFNSSILDFTLVNQRYLKQVDLSGCSLINTVNIINCSAYTEFTVNSLANLQEVKILNCDNIERIVITNCNKLNKINIELCPNLKTIIINNCPLLKSSDRTGLSISSCTSLETLNLSNNISLDTFLITNSNLAHIRTLDLSNTKVEYITGDNVDELTLDLSDYQGLLDFNIEANTEVSNILFANILNSPIPLIHTFLNCNKLERIYGNVILVNATYSGNWGLFRNCTKFSIHGNSINWKDTNIKLGNYIMSPWEILDSTGTHFDSITIDDLYLPGKYVTNIRFANTSNLFYYTFYNTAVSQFDTYYLLCAFALSGVTINQTVSFAFWEGAIKFDWSTGNMPNRYTFYKCDKLTAFSEAFNTSNYVYILSPEDNKDNGIFSPLTNVTSMNAMFSGSIVCSKKVFNRTNGNYPLTNISYQGFSLIIDDDNADNLWFLTYSNITDISKLKEHENYIGHFDGFFTNIPNLSSIDNTISPIAIDLDSLKIPDSIVTINSAFISTYAKGTLDLKTMFSNTSKCTAITHSFIFDGDNTFGLPTMPITSDTLKNLSKILYIGYRPTGANSGSATSTSFSGKLLNKFINQDTWVEDITANCSNLVVFAGFFKNLLFKDFAETPKIPGNMFNLNTRLLNVAALMMNADIAFKLSSNGFANCPNLNNVAYMCYHDVSGTSRSKIEGEIPYKLFYHGHNTATKTVYGINQEDKPSEDYSGLVSTLSITYNNYNRNISDIRYCFYGCIGITPYRNEANLVVKENNPDYTPFKWIYNSSNKSWDKGEDTYLLMAYYGYTGDPVDKESDVKYLELDVSLNTDLISNKSDTLNYICSPDLFRYCRNVATTLIYGVFSNCGLNYGIGLGGNINASEDLFTTGIQGRIVPYLLKPVSNITNVKEMFKNCRRISSYKLNAITYIVPQDFFSYALNITNLQETFQGLTMSYNTNLNVFGYLINSLDIRKVFAQCLYYSNSNGDTWTISNIFNTNKISRISGAFSYKDININDSVALGATTVPYLDVSVSLYIRFENNFTASRIPSSSAIGYVYQGYGNKATDTAIPNINENY